MLLSYFAFFFKPGAALSAGGHEKVVALVKAIPGLAKGHVYRPAGPGDYYFNEDGEPPVLALQLYYRDIEDLERAAGPDGALQALTRGDAFPSLAGAEVHHQAMVTRSFPVTDPTFQTPKGERHCSFLVHYPGQAEDLNAWLGYYVANHTKAMLSFPGLREIEVLSRVDWIDGLPGWTRVNYIQRNKVVFDSPNALSAALTSPAIKVMRADYAKFPPFTGANVHYPMLTEVIIGR